ncbi:MAG: ATPase, T2SS/T4P/T4SS family, partial [Candidatus Zixiibacteriota bacterium]
MNLRQRFGNNKNKNTKTVKQDNPGTVHLRRDSFQELKNRLHQKLIDSLDLSVLTTVDRGTLRDQIKDVLEKLLSEEDLFLSPENKERLITEIQSETLGLGPIEQYMHDPDVSDVLVNTYNQVYIEKHGKLELTDTKFKDDDHLMLIIDRIVSAVGRRIDESSPMVDARLADGSRVNAIIYPLALDGPILSIRRFRINVLSV